MAKKLTIWWLMMGLAVAKVAAAVSIGDLNCESRHNPVGIDVPRPQLNWIIESDRRGELQTPEVPERLLVGKEREFLTWFYDLHMVKREAITEDDLNETLRTFSGREGVLGSMGVYRAAFTSIEQTEALARLLIGHKVAVPVTALGGDKSLGANVEKMLKLVAKNVEGEVVSNCGHFLPEEYPAVVVRHILAMASKLTSTSKES